MILVGVLAMVAVAASLVTLMLAAEVPALDRVERFGDAARALAIARGGEASVIAALRRDATPDSDTPADWRLVSQQGTSIADGSFSLAIDDAQSRLNVNATTEPVLAAVAAARGLPGDTAARITRFIARRGAIADLSDLVGAGLSPAAIDALRPLLTALPGAAPLNLNSASEEVLAILIGDPAAARLLVARRTAAGCLTFDDLALLGVNVPTPNFSSDHVFATTTVTIGVTRQRLTSLIERRRVESHIEIAVLARTRGQRSR